MTARRTPFESIHSHGYVRVAACVPRVRVADPAYNLEQTLELARIAVGRGASFVLFPELGLSAYSIEDLFHQDALLGAVRDAAARLVEASHGLNAVLAVGMPLQLEGRLFNCAAVVEGGRVLGLVPKTYLPNYREFYEKRQFASGRDAVADSVAFGGSRVPFGNDLIFESKSRPEFRLHVEICEDLWVPIPPSTYAALAGATVLANLSASNLTIGKADYRRQLCAAHSGRCVAAYLYAAAGNGESTTDLAWDGHAMIWENAELLAESERFSDAPQVTQADVDLERLRQERMRLTSFADCAADYRDRVREMRPCPFDLAPAPGAIPLEREVSRFPYVPSDPERLDERCLEATRIQVHGLEQRLRATGLERAVIGVSGGLDSTQALLVTVKTFDRLGLPRGNILGCSMPGFATSARTRANAQRLMQALGVTVSEIDIRPSARQMLVDIGHPAGRGEEIHDVTYENVQAGERTSHLFRLANLHGGLVVGTGDLSELALGYTTYGVGDHMSHYNVNASVPKTLIQHLIRWAMRRGDPGQAASAVLRDIVDTAISPELIPGQGGDAEPAQRSEETVGPYELQDFNLYFVSRYGFRPSKVAFLAHHAWSDRSRGGWPPTLPDEQRRGYDLPTIKKWLEVFLRRFFEQSQFKRSAMPNGPKVGSGGSLSPRGDWRAPSDASAAAWLAELRDNVPD